MKGLLTGFLILLPALVFSQDFLSQFPFRKQATYFDFRYTRESPEAAEMARFGDGLVKLISDDFFKADFDFPIRVLVSEDRARFKEFVWQELHIADPPSFGIYDSRYKLFATYEGSGPGTFAHIMLSLLAEKDLRNRPEWAVQGIPTFFEKFYGYWKNDKLVVYWGFQNPWRIQQLGDSLTKLDLQKIISDRERSARYTAVQQDASAAGMASLFLWEQGRFKRFLKLIADGDKAGYETYFEAAMEMPMEKILPLWQSYLNDVAARRAKIMRQPVSKIFADEAAFQSFVKDNDLSLVQRVMR